MPNIKPSSSAPGELGSAERHAVARLLEAAGEALNDPAVTGDRFQLLAGHVAATLEGGALAVRQGWRAHVLDKLTADLDRHRKQLARGGGQP